MGLFDKKYCCACGEKIGFLGNRKLEDGNLCKNCAAKLSPWFDDRHHSTVDEIKQQLAYREENRESVSAFHVTRSFGQGTQLLLDDDNHKFMVCRTKNRSEENPDVLDFSQVTGCDLDIDEDKDEEKREVRDSEGNTRHESYNPPRYTYEYDFYMRIRVNHPYFNEIRFRLNRSSIRYEPAAQSGGMNHSNRTADLVGGILSGVSRAINQAANPTADYGPQSTDPRMMIPDYAECYQMGQEIKAALMQIHTQVREDIAAANAPKMVTTCPFCGATTTPDAAGRCEFCGGAVNG